MQNNNKYNSHLLPLITPEMLTRYPDQTCAILNKLIGMQSSVTVSNSSQAPGNLENIEQTTTSYDDGGVNIVTAYLSDGTTQDFQIRNGHKGSQGEPGADGTDGQDATIAVGTTTTLPAGSSATVTDSGTPSAAVLNFGIPKGTDGTDGFSPIANVTKSGDTATITITDENGTTTASVTDGTDGAPGQAATVTAGTTTTLPAGSSASVVNSGTSSAAVFDFSIPKGDTGAAGQDGADGADGFSPIATVSKVGDTATITITDENGTTTASVTDGSDGAPGAAATIAAGTTTTLSPGSSATVTNSGTSSAAVFDFGIPQGATGSPGADGADGADGFSPIATVTKSGDTATISITDANGTTTASVSDGATGPAGPSNTLSIGTVQSGATAAATITGTSPNQTLNLTLPKGDTGSPGAAATIAVGNTTTLPSGSSATVTNTGTSSAAVFDFGIPKGDAADPPESYKTASGTTITMADAGPSIKSINKVLGDTQQQTSPNPDYPQEVQTVTGRQVVTITDGDSESQEYEINLGKNLLPITMTSQTLNDVVFTVNSDGSIYANGTATARTEPRLYQSGAGVPVVKLSGGTTYHNTTNTTLYFYTGSYRSVGAGQNYTPTADETIQFCYIRIENGESIDDTIYPMLEKGATATTYAPYFEPIELCKIGDYQDYIYKSGENWYVHKETWNYTFTGANDEQWIRSGQSTATNFVAGMVNLQNFAMIGGENNEGYCNYFGFASSLADNKVILSGYQDGGYRFLLFRFTSGSTVTDLTSFTTWLGNNNIKMVLVLSTPIDTQITNSALIAELDALNEADLFDGSTTLTVSATSPNLPASLNLDYWTWFKGEAGSGGGHYTAGTGLNLVGHQFSVDTTVIAEKTDIPTVNNATLTIQKNGTNVQTFTANQSTNATANITVPESFSDLTGTVGTSQIDNGAVTADKIDWSTMCTTTDYSGTNSGNSWSMKEFKYADGTMELWGLISFGSLTTHTIDTCTITYPTAFTEAPTVVVGLVTGSSAWTLGNFSVAYVPNMDKTYAAFRCYNGSTENRDGAATFTIRGRWK